VTDSPPKKVIVYFEEFSFSLFVHIFHNMFDAIKMAQLLKNVVVIIFFFSGFDVTAGKMKNRFAVNNFLSFRPPSVFGFFFLLLLDAEFFGTSSP
jgi:hypothetical protein